MRTFIIFIILSILSACIKQEGKIPASAATGETTGGSGGGASSGPDPLAKYAWHLENTAQSTFSDGQGIAGHDIDLKQALAQGVTGKGVRIAISDSGTDIEHLDLAANALEGEHRNYGSSNPDNWHNAIPYTTGHDAHGTAVTGLSSAVGYNGLGSRGVAYNSKFAAFKYIMNYSSSITEASLLIRNIDQTDGDFDIFNYSYGYNECLFVEEDEDALAAIEAGVSDLRDGKGALYVQAAGNGYLGLLSECLGVVTSLKYAHNTNFSSDLSTPHKIIVGAVNAEGKSASYSSPGSGIWVSAPGGEDGELEPAMLSTDISGCQEGYSSFYNTDSFNLGSNSLNKGCNYTSFMNGTSAATPVVSGVVALMLEKEPRLTWRDVKHILATTADVIDPVNTVLPHPFGAELEDYDYDYKWNKNGADIFYSNWYGFGRVNADKAVRAAGSYDFSLGEYETTSNPNNGEWYYSSGTLNEDIPDEDAEGVEHTITVKHNFVVEAVQVKLNISHTLPSDLGIHLKSPSGELESRLLNINSNVYAFEFPADKILLTNAFYGETSGGDWTIRIVDASGSETGTLIDWSILIHGHRMEGDGSNPNPVGTVTMGANYPSRSYSPPVTFIPSSSSDIVRYEVSVGNSAGTQDQVKWYSIGTSTSFQVSGMRLKPNNYYYLNIRAIDDQENTSAVSSKMWRAY